MDSEFKKLTKDLTNKEINYIYILLYCKSFEELNSNDFETIRNLLIEKYPEFYFKDPLIALKKYAKEFYEEIIQTQELED
jgi:hypothetical protein